jgi:hypothetical protein
MPTAAQKKEADAKAKAAETNEADAKAAAELVGSTASKKPAASKPTKAELYVNKSSVNVYTTVGRCGPDDTVELTPEEAKNYAGLEPCQG